MSRNSSLGRMSDFNFYRVFIMRELSIGEVAQVHGGIYEGANPWIAVTAVYAAAVIVTGGGALALTGALLSFAMVADSSMK